MPDGDEASFLGEFSQRLRSGDLGVVCDALSDYQQAQADTRWGVDNPYWPLNNEVLFVARDLLDRSSTLDDENRHRALSWSLTAVWHLGEDEDADRIAEILETTSDPGLREEGLMAASTALGDAEEPNPRLLAAVRAIALDESLDARDRGWSSGSRTAFTGRGTGCGTRTCVARTEGCASPRRTSRTTTLCARCSKAVTWPPSASPWTIGGTRKAPSREVVKRHGNRRGRSSSR
ncbi:hypothetical protein GCM10010402_26530 [Actinomadura luteofluorescens]|uniref:hypothetical protein n=1 Tax=Actinomadura luteofluorescens TaxID=46163 RepID=UPI0021645B66|nr:hypothetical protein [Actinomadura glauciflava]